MANMPKAPTTKVPSNLEVTINKDKVIVNDKREIEVFNGNIRILIQRTELSSWQSNGWKSVEDIKKEAEDKIAIAKLEAQNNG